MILRLSKLHRLEISPSNESFLKVDLFQGLCAYVLKTVNNAAHRGVVVGHDHRHHSERWAALTAAAFLSRGMKVYLLRGFVHTPLYVFHTTVFPISGVEPHFIACHLASEHLD